MVANQVIGNFEYLDNTRYEKKVLGKSWVYDKKKPYLTTFRVKIEVISLFEFLKNNSQLNPIEWKKTKRSS